MVKDDATKILEEDLVVINPEVGDDLDLMRTKMEGRKAREKAAKKAKKELKRAKDEKESPDSTESGASNGEAVSKKLKPTEVADKKVEKKKKLSVQDDRTKSEAYKSLFSSHKSAQNKPKGNWVTFDPRYN